MLITHDGKLSTRQTFEIRIIGLKDQTPIFHDVEVTACCVHHAIEFAHETFQHEHENASIITIQISHV